MNPEQEQDEDDIQPYFDEAPSYLEKQTIEQGQSHPYAALGPDTVLDALASVDLYGDGRLLSLNSYENRVYLVYLEDGGSVVVKFYRPKRWTEAQILEEHRFAAELLAQEIPVIAPLSLSNMGTAQSIGLAQSTGADQAAGAVQNTGSVQTTLSHFKDFAFAVYPRCGGRSPELDQDVVLERIGRFLGRIHRVGSAKPFEHRPALDMQSFGFDSRDFLVEHALVPRELREPWMEITEQALHGAAQAFKETQDCVRIRLHGDCHPGNILWTEGGEHPGPHFVDLDDARSGPAMQDLWMLLSGDRRDMTRQLSSLLAGYEDFMDFDRRELRLLEPLRTLRLIHYSAWIARRWSDPAFPAAFPWFNTQRYWQDRILELREQVAAMQEEPLVV
jgi:Ser/Thr protein kinase RdoA (MazF antagonist)